MGYREEQAEGLKWLDQVSVAGTRMLLEGKITGFALMRLNAEIEERRRFIEKVKPFLAMSSMKDRQHDRDNYVLAMKKSEGQALILREGKWQKTTQDRVRQISLSSGKAIKWIKPKPKKQDIDDTRVREELPELVLAYEKVNVKWLRVTREQGRVAQGQGLMVKWGEDPAKGDNDPEKYFAEVLMEG